MKVYILRSHTGDEGDDLFGVFSTEEKANQAKHDGEAQYPLRDWYVDSVDVDYNFVTNTGI